MARRYSRKKGKAGSNIPTRSGKPSWSSLSDKEVSLLVTKLAKEGNNAAQIGMILRDSYGIPNVKAVTGKSISGVLDANKLTPEVPDDLLALIKKALLIQKHLETNKQDQPGKRGYELTQSKIRRLTKYYKKTGKLPQDWTYDPEKIKLLIG